MADICIEQAQKAGIFKGMELVHRFREETTKAALDKKNLDARESLMQFYFDAPGIAGGDIIRRGRWRMRWGRSRRTVTPPTANQCQS